MTSTPSLRVISGDPYAGELVTLAKAGDITGADRHVVMQAAASLLAGENCEVEIEGTQTALLVEMIDGSALQDHLDLFCGCADVDAGRIVRYYRNESEEALGEILSSDHSVP